MLSQHWLIMTTNFLVNATCRGSFLLLVAGLVVLLMRRSSAAQRHAVWVTTIAAVLLLPIGSALLPQLPVLPQLDLLPLVASQSIHVRDAPTDSQSGGEKDHRRVNATTKSSTTVAPKNDLATTTNRRDHPDAEPTPNSNLRPSTENRNQQGFSAGETPSHSVSNAEPSPFVTSDSGSKKVSRRTVERAVLISLAGWLFGVGVVFGRIALGCLALRRVRAQSELLSPNKTGGEQIDADKKDLRAIYELCEALRREVGVPAVELLWGSQRTTPMAWGVRTPRVFLPKAARGWSHERLRAVLLHELAHIRRRDPLSQWLLQCSSAVYWFNPLFWLAAWRIRVERERACDDFVVGNGVSAADYAEHLLRIASGFEKRGLSSALGMASGSVEPRLRALLRDGANRTGLNRLWFAGIVIAAIIISVPLAMLRAEQTQQKEAKSQLDKSQLDKSQLDVGAQEALLTNAELAELQKNGRLVGSPDGWFFGYVASLDKKTELRICDSVTREIVKRKTHVGTFKALQFSKKGLAVVGQQGQKMLVLPFDEKANAQVHRVKGVETRLVIVGHDRIRHGEVVTFDIYVRNTSDKVQECHFRPAPKWRWGVRKGRISLDADRQPLQRTDGFISSIDLLPGEEKRVLRKRVRLLIQPEGWNDPDSHYNVDVLALPRGTYEVGAADVGAALPALNAMGFVPARLSAGAIDLAVVGGDVSRPPTERRVVTADMVRVAWGKPQRGLQAGIAWSTNDYHDNQMDSKEVYIRNTANSELTFEFLQPAYGSLRQFRIDKKETPTRGQSRGFAAFRTVTLQSGETVLIGSPNPPGMPSSTGSIGHGVVGVELDVWFTNRTDPKDTLRLRTGTMDLRDPEQVRKNLGFFHEFSDEELQRRIARYSTSTPMRGPQTKEEQRRLIDQLEKMQQRHEEWKRNRGKR